MNTGGSELYLARVLLCVAIMTRTQISSASCAETAVSDWRSDYKSMCQACHDKHYDRASEYGNTALIKILSVQNPVEKEVALEKIIDELSCIDCKYEKQQNYGQQESVLRNMLKAEEARCDYAQTYEIENAKRQLAGCLVLQGKNEEAALYWPKPEKKLESSSEESTDLNLVGWRKSLALMNQAKQVGDPSKALVYATTAVKEALSVKNATEKTVALEKTNQELRNAAFEYERKKDYPNQEKLLKLMLTLQPEDLETNLFENPFYFQKQWAIESLITCLIMQGKDKEAETYDLKLKKIKENQTKSLKEMVEKMQQTKK